MTKVTRKKAYLQILPQIVDALKSGYKPEKIILFGSLIDPNKESNDIDLFLIKETSVKKLGDRAEEARSHLPFLDIPIDLIVYTPREVELYRSRSVMLHEVFKGRVLYG